MDCRRAIAAMIAWEHTASVTGDARHTVTAGTCRAIAIERLRVALAEHVATDKRRALVRIVREILDSAEQSAGAASLAEIRVMLARLEAESDPP
jgi:hypothetical protein